LTLSLAIASPFRCAVGTGRRNYKSGPRRDKTYRAASACRLLRLTFGAGIDPASCAVREGRMLTTEGQAMDDRVVKSPQEASQGQKPGVTRYVLTVGLVLVVILFVVAYLIVV
jgi:hypothetical protein